jgi:hypothetical protein
MSNDINSIEEYNNHCNKRLNIIWQNLPKIEHYADLLPQGQRKQYLQAINQVMSFVGELYLFNTVTFAELQKLQRQLQPLYKEVFGDKEITLPYVPEDNETIRFC